MEKLLQNVHTGLNLPCSPVQLIKGSYSYYHYLCDGTDDRGWGCGYRTLQTILSWIQFNKQNIHEHIILPNICDIQEALVKMEDKQNSFVNSREWLGSFEVCLCIDYFHDVPCKIQHIRSGENIYEALQILWQHFRDSGSPVMMGGNTDASSKCILGICGKEKVECCLLILDPHCSKTNVTTEELISDKWVAWRNIDTLLNSSFYNLCLPQVKSKLG
ncbi:ufm1-specific protease 1-like [Ciona intestinalis]